MPSDFTLVADMSRMGMAGCMWSNARIPQGEDNLYKFVRLASNPWFDERLVRIAKVIRHIHTLSLSCIIACYHMVLLNDMMTRAMLCCDDMLC